MKINEIFYSIQGESMYAGLPCVFIRTAGCNLSCAYCDTKYAQMAKYELVAESILKQINDFPHTHLVEITGGEPLLQPDIYDLINLLHSHNWKILLETNGSLDLAAIPEYVCKIIDVKTPSSCHTDSFLTSNLEFFHPDKDNLKFVLGDLADYHWMRDFLLKNNLFGSSILVSAVYGEISPKIIADHILADGLNVRLQLQLHKYIWHPDKKSV